jgi:PEGA domain-containing protein
MKAGLATLFVAALAIGASRADAQTSPPPGPPPATPPPMTAAPLPPMPSLPASLTVPNPFGGLIPGPRDLYQSPTGGDRFQQLPVFQRPPIVIGGGGGGYYGWPYYPDPFMTPSLEGAYQRRVEPRGSLRIETIPGFAQVFVDGFYSGVADEFGVLGRPLTLTAGSHRVELRAPGYETLAFSVLIEANEIVRYRGDMQSLVTKPPVTIAPSQPAAAKSFYVIPKCYAGDKPPKGTLPPGCNPKNLQTYK